MEKTDERTKWHRDASFASLPSYFASSSFTQRRGSRSPFPRNSSRNAFIDFPVQDSLLSRSPLAGSSLNGLRSTSQLISRSLGNDNRARLAYQRPRNRRESKKSKSPVESEIVCRMRRVLCLRLSFLLALWFYFFVSTSFSKSYDRLSVKASNLCSHVAHSLLLSDENPVKDAISRALENSKMIDYQNSTRYLPISPPRKVYPSLNILDYDESIEFPVFPDHDFPFGLSRKDMPQLDFDRNTYFWEAFRQSVQNVGGRITVYNRFDLRLARPLQRELSGYIVHNILFENVKRKFSAASKTPNEKIFERTEVLKPEQNITYNESQRKAELGANEKKHKAIAASVADSSNLKDYFSSKIILVKSPSSVMTNKGGYIDKGSFFILDGHHTTYVAANLCAMSPHTLLRLGNFHGSDGACGKLFDPKQDIQVIEGLDLFKVREIALNSGADSGHDMMVQAHP